MIGREGSLVRRALGAALLAAAVPGPAVGQAGGSVRGGAVFEDYSVAAGLGFESVTEVSVPVVVALPVGRWGDLHLSSGWARVEVGLEDGSAVQVSGPLDTEARLSVELIRDRLRLLVSGSLPTGREAFADDELAILAPLGNDLLGFASPTLGAGGRVAVGLAAAGPLGRGSVGLGVNVRRALTYEPLTGSDDEVRAGTELRIRLGLERPVGRRGMARVAGIYSLRGRDRLNGVEVNGVGDRVAAYATLETPLGPAVATLWGSGVYRSDPSLEPTAVGAAFVPRGGLLATGARLTFALGGLARLEPHAEYRTASAAPDAAGLTLEDQGHVLRFGALVRRPLGRLGASLDVEGVRGSLIEGLRTVDVTGLRASIVLEWVP